MNRFKKGPQIKLSGLKAPAALTDLYYDLRDRRLLPFVIVLLVAIVLAPIALSSSSQTSPIAPPVSGASAAVATPTSDLVVTKAEPGLRAYQRRFKHLTPTDPFREPPQSSGPSEGGSSEAGGSPEGGGTPGEGESGSSGGEAVPPTVETHHTVTYFTYAIDVKVTPGAEAGGKKGEKPQPTVRNNLPPLTMLPSRDTPAFTYMGPSKDGKKAIMLVSDNVGGVFGDATCIVGGETCQLLALEPGVPETVAWGADSRTFKIELLKIFVQTTDHLNRAPLGKPPKNSSAAYGSRRG